MSDSRIKRHSLAARLMHWLMAASVLALLATGLLPVVGVEFDWVTIHWIAGVILTVLLLIHTIRGLFGGMLKAIWFRGRDIAAAMKNDLVPGKYSFAQKMMHNSVGLFGLAVVITGCMMLLRIETPLWERNPYFLSEQAWGVVYVIHGLSALAFLAMVMLHIYFAFRPEKRLYLKAIITGEVDAADYAALHRNDQD